MAANVFNNGFSTSYPIGDGAALLSTSHPLWGGGTSSNKLATPADFSESALEDLLIQIRNCVDDRNLPTPINPKQLVVGNSNYFQAVRILRTMQRVGTTDNDINAIKSVGIFGNDPVVLRRPDRCRRLVRADRRLDGPAILPAHRAQKGGQEDFKTGNWEQKARERWSIGCTNWRALFGSEGA